MNDKVNVLSNKTIRVSDENNNEFIITDANGDVFNASLNDIIDVSTFDNVDISNVNDNYSHLSNFTPNVTDSLGNDISYTELVDSIKSDETIALDVTFESTHSGENLNHAVYTSSSLEKDTRSWLFPFAKPLIKNHNLDEEPIGRTIDSSFGQSEFDENKDCVDTTFRVTDKDAMVKFADRRYQTMSIGATAGHIRCNTCGKDILKDENLTFCGHWKGRVYAGKKSTWTVENMTFREGSIVNTPADVLAQVKRIKVIKRGKEENSMKDHEDDNILNDMDGILKDDQESDSQSIEDNKTNPDSTKDNEDNQPSNVASDTSNIIDNNEITILKDKVVQLEKEVATLKADKEELSDNLNTSNDSLTVVTTDNEALLSEVKKVKNQARRMAEFNLNLMKDNLKDLNPEMTDAELEGKTAKEMNEMIQDFRSQEKSRDVGSITNPGLAIKNEKTDVEDDDENKKQQEENLTMKDMEDVVLKIWDKHC